MKRLFTREAMFVAGVIFLAIFFAKFPTLYHWFNTPEGYWYPKQTSWFDAWDTNFQVSYMRYGQLYGMGLVNTYATIPHGPVYIYQYYTFLGVINRLFNLDPFILFHIASIVTGIVLIVACYMVAKELFSDQIIRLSAFVVMVLGGGFGFLSLLSFSADLKIAGFTLVNALERGHDALSTVCLLLTFVFLHKFFQTFSRSSLYWAGVFSCISILLHPPFAVVYLLIGLIVSLWIYVIKKIKITVLYPIAIVLFFGIYYLSALSALLDNPGFSGLINQKLFNVDSLSLVSGFGLLSIPLFIGLVFGKNSLKMSLVKIFFLSQLFFALSPFGFHLYFMKGVFIWAVTLAFLMFPDLIPNRRYLLIAVTFVTLFSLLPRFYVFQKLIKIEKNNSFFFLSESEGDMLSKIERLPQGSSILSLYRIGNYIPAHSNNRVYFGHKFQTPNSLEKETLAKAFYSKMDKERQLEFIRNNTIDFVYYGLEEMSTRKLERLPLENPFSYFPTVASNSGILLYDVRNIVN
ncbi:hypothetical protein HYW55_03645 [Candidatus Gottesmanbacteria bacterium]|nr:hypothetical protein [Candidatus Gottesmanbacteria bacterium]